MFLFRYNSIEDNTAEAAMQQECADQFTDLRSMMNMRLELAGMLPLAAEP